MSGKRISALFVNQGAIGSSVLGHVSVEQALRLGLAGVSDIDAQFMRLPPWMRVERIAAGRVPGMFKLDLDLHGQRWHLVEARRGRRCLKGVRQAEVDVLHVDSHVAALRMGSWLSRVPTLLSVDTSIWEWRRMGFWPSLKPYSRAALGISLKLERRAFRQAAAVVARSRWAADGVRRECPEARISVIHPGIDLERFCPQRPRHHSERGPNRVLFVGGRFHEKGGDDLLAALADDLGASIELDLVTGDSIPTRPGVRVHRLSPGSPALIELYREADVVCLPTHGDSFGWTILEAMACGVPVVSTAFGAIPELLGDGRGVIVPAWDPRVLGQTVRGLLDNPERRCVLRAAALAHVREHYDVRVQGLRLAQLIREVAAV